MCKKHPPRHKVDDVTASDTSARVADLADRFSAAYVVLDSAASPLVYRRFAGHILIVRPDGHVHAVTRIDRHCRWAEAIENHLSELRPRPAETDEPIPQRAAA